MGQTAKRIFALSRIPQVDYATAVTVSTTPKNYEQIEKKGYDFANPSTSVVNNAGYTTGTPNPTVQEINKHDYAFSLDERMTAARLGRRATAAFGLPVSTPVSGSTGAIKHVFQPLSPFTESSLPVFTYVEKLIEPANAGDQTDDRKLPSAALESINFQSEAANDAYLNAVSAWRTSGKVIEPSGVTFGTGTTNVLLFKDAGETSLKAGQAVVKIYPNVSLGGTALTLGCAFRNVQIGYNTGTNFDIGYNCGGNYQNSADPNSGLVRGSAPAGNPQITLSFSLVKSITNAQTFNPLLKYRTQTEFSISFKYIAGLVAGVTGTPINNSADFQFADLAIASITQGDDAGTETYDITATPLTLGNSYPFLLELINNIPNYTTAT